jgi:hypothetical protein
VTAIALAFTASIAWGCSDFLGGLRARRVPAPWSAHLVGGVVVAFVSARSRRTLPRPHRSGRSWSRGWAASSPSRALQGASIGPMSIVAPISATTNRPSPGWPGERPLRCRPPMPSPSRGRLAASGGRETACRPRPAHGISPLGSGVALLTRRGLEADPSGRSFGAGALCLLGVLPTLRPPADAPVDAGCRHRRADNSHGPVRCGSTLATSVSSP